MLSCIEREMKSVWKRRSSALHKGCGCIGQISDQEKPGRSQRIIPALMHSACPIERHFSPLPEKHSPVRSALPSVLLAVRL